MKLSLEGIYCFFLSSEVNILGAIKVHLHLTTQIEFHSGQEPLFKPSMPKKQGSRLE
jgi:hypothetical protein